MIDYKAWHDLMVSHGWTPRRDIFGNIYQYEKNGRICHCSDFARLAGLRILPRVNAVAIEDEL